MTPHTRIPLSKPVPTILRTRTLVSVDEPASLLRVRTLVFRSRKLLGQRIRIPRLRNTNTLSLPAAFPSRAVAYSRTGAEPPSTSTTSLRQTEQQQRRRQSRGFHVPPEGLTDHSHTTAAETARAMSLDRSPSREHGGWSSPGLSTPYENGDRGKSYGDVSMNGNGSAHGVTWAKARAKSARVQQDQTQQGAGGFVARHIRRLSESLPYFAHGGQEDRFAEKEKLGRGRAGGWSGSGSGEAGWRQVPRRVGLLVSRKRKYVALGLLAVIAVMVWFWERECCIWHEWWSLSG